MAVPNAQTEVTASSSTPLAPLIEEDQPQNHPQEEEEEEEEENGDEDESDVVLSKPLLCLEIYLRILGFCQDSILSFTLSWLSFILLVILLPLLIIEFTYYSESEKYEIRGFEIEILVSRSLVAAISLLCISRNLRKYGVRKFLFVDRYHGHTTQFRQEYVQKIHGFFRLVAFWILPCFLLKAAREITHLIYAHHSWWQSAGTFVALLVSWTYSTLIYLTGGALFHLLCDFQVIHLENYSKLLEKDLDVSMYIEEHTLLRHHLSKISHRFRIFLVLEFLIVMVSQCVALLETTGNPRIINFANGGDFAVTSIAELVGIIICLHGAAKISHRAQALGSIACRWHASIACNQSNGTSLSGLTNNGGNLEAAYPIRSVPISYSDSDLESADYCMPMPTNTQLASYMTLYNKRQALVTYLQSNPGGVTIFGWTIDRSLIDTIFFIELTLVLFVLGKTISLSTD